MRVAIDVSHLEKSNLASHNVRGAGRYIQELFKSLKDLDKDNEYELVDQPKSLSDFDVVHYPYFEPFFLSLPITSKVPSVVTVHDLIPLIFPKKFPVGVKGRIKWEIQKQALKNKSVIVTDSESSKKDIAKLAGISLSKIKVVYLFASIVYRQANDRQVAKEYDLPDEFILYVGDATWNKNLVRLAEAVERTESVMVMAGKSIASEDFDKKNAWNRELMEFKNKVKGNKHFIFPGFVEDKDLISLYNLATAFVMPSLYEGFGLPLLEAMQAGCPVIASREGSLEEVGGGAPYYVDPNSVDSIAEGITKVISDKKLRDQLSIKSLDQAKKFNKSKFVGEMKAVYEDVVR